MKTVKKVEAVVPNEMYRVETDNKEWVIEVGYTGTKYIVKGSRYYNPHSRAVWARAKSPKYVNEAVLKEVANES